MFLKEYRGRFKNRTLKPEGSRHPKSFSRIKGPSPAHQNRTTFFKEMPSARPGERPTLVLLPQDELQKWCPVIVLCRQKRLLR
jgi:hypothetical protein